jgi:four helix bundle protein
MMANWEAGFTRLEAWQVAHEVGGEIYDRASRLPHPHLYALGGQLMRAALSLPVNIAKGFGRRFPREKAQFYSVSTPQETN